MIKFATVSPCYNEEAVLEKSVQRLTTLFDELVEKGKIAPDSMIVLVNDGSMDKTWDIICRLQAANPYVRGINLAHNVGHQYAIMAGMMTMRHYADAVVTIDVDLQDDITVIEQMIDLYVAGNDVVYGVKVSRTADPVLKRMSAVAFYKLQRKMGVKAVFNHADFRLLSRRALDILSSYPERNVYLRGLIPMFGLPSATVDDVIKEREAGVSKYTLGKMLGLALDGITSFSVKPIYMIVTAGLCFVVISFIILIYVLHALIVHTAFPGWASLILSMWFIGGMIMISIGMVGLYIGKIYTEVKQRPLFNIAEMVGFEHEED